MHRNRKRIFLCPKDTPPSPRLEYRPIELPPIVAAPAEVPAEPEVVQRNPGTSPIPQATKKRVLSSVSDDGKLLKAPRIVFKGHRLAVTCVGVLQSPTREETLVFTGSEDKRVLVWSLKTGENIAELNGHTQKITSIATFNSSGYNAVVITAGWDERVRIWPVQECFAKITSSAEETAAEEPATEEPAQSLSERISNKCVVLRGHKNRIFGLAVMHGVGEEPVVASGSSDNTIRVWALPGGELLYVLEDERDDTWNLCLRSWFVSVKHFTQCGYHGTVILSGCKNNTVRVWKHRTAAQIRAQAQADVAVRLAAAKAPAASFSAQAFVSRKAHAVPALIIRGHRSAVHSLAPFDAQDHHYVATACKDADVRIWSLVTGLLVKTLKGHTSPITAVTAYNPLTSRDGPLVVSCSKEDAHIRVWKCATGELLRSYKGHSAEIHDVLMLTLPPAASPQGFADADPTRPEDLVIVSGSRDTNVRSWLYADEKTLRVLEHPDEVKIKAMDVYCPDGVESVVVTGADNGSLTAWNARRDVRAEPTPIWLIENAHKTQITAVAIYTPMDDSENFTTSHWPGYLHNTLVISTSRNGFVRMADITTGEEVCPHFVAHSKAITSVCVYSGHKGNILSKAIDPFLVTGSEDHSARIWSMVNCTCLRTLNRHIFDVTAVAVFLPLATRDNDPRKQRALTQRQVLATTETAVDDAAHQYVGPVDPIIVTGGMDDTIRMWQYSTGLVVDALTDIKCHITCLAYFTIPASDDAVVSGTVLAAGDGNGTIWLWSGRCPYQQVACLKGHVDEVRSLSSYSAEGNPPVLVSASLDCTVKVWNLETMALLKTIEGHTADVSAVRIFPLAGGDLALVSASSDSTARVVYEFTETAPQHDLVMQLFQFDVDGTNTHVVFDSHSAFPRIAQLAEREGPEQFFGTYHFLFGEALRRGRPDFLEEFLQCSQLGLLKSNKEVFTPKAPSPKARMSSKSSRIGFDKDVMEEVGGMLTHALHLSQGEHSAQTYGSGGLLRQALERRDFRAVRCIIDCWCRFFADHDSELIHDDELGRISMGDMILLSEISSPDFQKLICSITLVPTKDNFIAPGSYYLYENELQKATMLGMVPHPDRNSAASAKKTRDYMSNPEEKKFTFLPLVNAVHMDMLQAYTRTCVELDSVEIFNSEVGKLALSYAWRRSGLKVHLRKMWVYLVYIVISTVSLLMFNEILDRESIAPIAPALIVAQLAINVFFIKEEWQQFSVTPLDYLKDVWNCLDLIVIFTNTTANVLRLIHLKDSIATEVLLCVSSIVSYFNILYFLRAFESTGPLVSMILRISKDIRYLMFVVLLVCMGFSQAFWIVSRNDRSLPFSTFEGAVLYSFVFLLGGFDPTLFEGIPLYRFAIAMSSIYMIIVSILLLNLLIALMGDSYGSVKEKGLAQWKLEQAQIITEMQGSMDEEKRASTAVVYFRRNADATDDSDSQTQEQMEQTLRELKQNQAVMMRMLREQSEANSALREQMTRLQARGELR